MITVNSVYNPLSYDEMNKAVSDMAKLYTEIENQNNLAVQQAGTIGSGITENDSDRQYRDQYNAYQKGLNDAASAMAQTGDLNAAKRAMHNLGNVYANQMIPIAKAVEDKQKAYEAWQKAYAADPTIIGNNPANMAIDAFYGNKKPNLNHISGAEAEARGKAQGVAYASRFDETTRKSIAGAYEAIRKRGINQPTAEDIRKELFTSLQNGKISSEKYNDVVNLINDVQRGFDYTGLTKDEEKQVNERILTGFISGLKYEEGHSYQTKPVRTTSPRDTVIPPVFGPTQVRLNTNLVMGDNSTKAAKDIRILDQYQGLLTDGKIDKQKVKDQLDQMANNFKFDKPSFTDQVYATNFSNNEYNGTMSDGRRFKLKSEKGQGVIYVQGEDGIYTKDPEVNNQYQDYRRLQEYNRNLSRAEKEFNRIKETYNIPDDADISNYKSIIERDEKNTATYEPYAYVGIPGPNGDKVIDTFLSTAVTKLITGESSSDHGRIKIRKSNGTDGYINYDDLMKYIDQSTGELKNVKDMEVDARGLKRSNPTFLVTVYDGDEQRHVQLEIPYASIGNLKNSVLEAKVPIFAPDDSGKLRQIEGKLVDQILHWEKLAKQDGNKLYNFIENGQPTEYTAEQVLEFYLLLASDNMTASVQDNHVQMSGPVRQR